MKPNPEMDKLITRMNMVEGSVKSFAATYAIISECMEKMEELLKKTNDRLTKEWYGDYDEPA